MKKILIIIAALTISASAFSQNFERAVGVKLGYFESVTYKQFITPSNALNFEVDLGIINTTQVWGSANYLWNFDIKGAPGLCWYIGPGVNLGVHSKKFDIGLNCMGGVEYKFANIPLAISFDYKPTITFINGFNGLWSGGGIGAKYTF